MTGCGHGGAEPTADVSTSTPANAAHPRPGPFPTDAAAGGRGAALPRPRFHAQERLVARVRALVAANDLAAARACGRRPGRPIDRRRPPGPPLAWVELKGGGRRAAAAGTAWRADSTNAVRLSNYGITRLQAGDVLGAEHAFREALRATRTCRALLPNLAIISAFYRMDAWKAVLVRTTRPGH